MDSAVGKGHQDHSLLLDLFHRSGLAEHVLGNTDALCSLALKGCSLVGGGGGTLVGVGGVLAVFVGAGVGLLCEIGVHTVALNTLLGLVGRGSRTLVRHSRFSLAVVPGKTLTGHIELRWFSSCWVVDAIPSGQQGAEPDNNPEFGSGDSWVQDPARLLVFTWRRMVPERTQAFGYFV